MHQELLNNRHRLVLLLLVAVAMVLRSPELLVQPRFWAEEGNIYYRFAFMNPWWESLVFVHREAGYLSIATNIPATLAAYVPMAYAPLVTTWFGFLGQLVPFAIILWGRAKPWETTGRKLLACAVLVLVPTAGHGWLNSLHLPYWLGLASFCILMEPTEERVNKRVVVYLFVLFLGFLTGPQSLFLSPLFGLKWLLDRQRVNLLFVICALVCGSWQLWEVSRSKEKMNPQRRPLSEFSLAKPAASVLSHHFVEPITGRDLALKLYDRTRHKESWLSRWFPIAFLPFLLLLMPTTKKPEAWFPILALILGTVLTTLFAFEFHPTGRYSVFPGFMMMTALLSSVAASRSQGPRFLSFADVRYFTCMFLLAFTLGAGLVTYRNWSYLKHTEDTPAWREEVEKWEENHRYWLEIWPVDWKIRYLVPREEWMPIRHKFEEQ